MSGEVVPKIRQESVLARNFSNAREYLGKVVSRMRWGEQERVAQDYSLPISRLSQKGFQRLLNKISSRDHVDIKMKWERHSDDEFILNLGAGPCTIIFAHDKTNNEIISSHYPTTTLKNRITNQRERLLHLEQKYNQDRNGSIVIPNDSQAAELQELAPSSTDFFSLVDELRVLKNDGAEIEIYLFGNNVSIMSREEAKESGIDDYEQYRSEMLTHLLGDRHSVVQTFHEAGLEFEDIHDFRQSVGFETAVDNAAYIPGVGIYYTRGSVLKR